MRGFFNGETQPGNAPDKSHVALLVVDVINDLEFDGGDQLLPHALKMASSLARLIKRARKYGVPVVYANKNHETLGPDFSGLLTHCIEDGVRGERVTKLLRPSFDDYLVLKYKESGFFSTTLDTLLRFLGTDTLIITGMSTDNCVLSTAKDAYIRDFRLFIPSDCVAAENEEVSAESLTHMKRVLKADTRPSSEINFRRLLESSSEQLNSH